jgi:hypothetical protein
MLPPIFRHPSGAPSEPSSSNPPFVKNENTLTGVAVGEGAADTDGSVASGVDVAVAGVAAGVGEDVGVDVGGNVGAGVGVGDGDGVTGGAVGAGGPWNDRSSI